MRKSKKVKIDDIARIVGVSSMTVSRALNNKPDISPETKKRILEVVKELKYYPNIFAKGLVQKKSGTIGIIGPTQGITYDNPYFAGLMRGIESVCIEKSYDFLIKIYSHHYEKLNYLKIYYEGKVDGVILIIPDISHPELKDIEENRLPYVIIGTRLENQSISWIDSENRLSMAEGVEKLISLGHREIAFVKGPESQRDANDRFEGFLYAMKKNNLSVNPEWLIDGNFLFEDGINAFKSLCRSKRLPSAVVCANDLMALGLINEALRQGYKIPHDLSVLGFNGVPFIRFSRPKLTTIMQPLEEMGKKAAELLFKKMESQDFIEENYIFPCKWVDGETVAGLSF
ncbi:MAG: LacI family DNA-binding transcriptional regulator [Brevinematia bacterium]